jgi:hypothetical protein
MFKSKTGILFWDIETSKMLLGEFALKNNGYISPANIYEDWSIYCGAYKFSDQKNVTTVSVTYKDLKNDKAIVKQLRDVLEDTRLIIAHNGDRFDLKKLNTRIAFYHLKPLDHKILTFDTLKAAKKHFAFTSNRLDYLGRFLEVGRKMEHKMDDPWMKLLRGKDVKETLAHMTEYCGHDVELLEAVYNRLKPYCAHPNLNGFNAEDRIACPNCGSGHMQKRGTRVTRAGTLFQQYQCQDKECGAWSSESIQQSPTIK